MFYQLPHVPVSLIPSIDPLPDLFPKESPTSMSESPPSIIDVPSHASDELPAPIIGVPIDTAPTVDPTGSSDSHTLCRSHRVTTLPSHLRDFHCFSALASLQEPQNFHEASSNPLWQQAMKEELDALHKTGTLDLVTLTLRGSLTEYFDYGEHFMGLNKLLEHGLQSSFLLSLSMVFQAILISAQKVLF